MYVWCVCVYVCVRVSVVCVCACVCVCVCVCLFHTHPLCKVYTPPPHLHGMLHVPHGCTETVEHEVLPNRVDPLTTRGHHTHYKVTSTALARRESMDNLKGWTVAKIIDSLSNAALAEQFWPVRKEISCSHPDMEVLILWP